MPYNTYSMNPLLAEMGLGLGEEDEAEEEAAALARYVS
jgi:hypothetical protein